MGVGPWSQSFGLFGCVRPGAEEPETVSVSRSRNRGPGVRWGQDGERSRRRNLGVKGVDSYPDYFYRGWTRTPVVSKRS